MAQWLRILAAFDKIFDTILSTHIAIYNHLSLQFQGI